MSGSDFKLKKKSSDSWNVRKNASRCWVINVVIARDSVPKVGSLAMTPEGWDPARLVSPREALTYPGKSRPFVPESSK